MKVGVRRCEARWFDLPGKEPGNKSTLAKRSWLLLRQTAGQRLIKLIRPNQLGPGSRSPSGDAGPHPAPSEMPH